MLFQRQRQLMRRSYVWLARPRLELAGYRINTLLVLKILAVLLSGLFLLIFTHLRICTYMLHWGNEQFTVGKRSDVIHHPPTIDPQSPSVHVAISVCGDRLNDTLVFVKSLMITATGPVVLHAFVTPELKDKLFDQVMIMQKHFEQTLKLNIRDLFWPNTTFNGVPVEFWKEHYPTCPFQRVLFPLALPNLDKVIYVDSDSVFLSPVQELWAEFSKIRTNQYIGLAIEQFEGGPSFYDHFTSHPIHGTKGVNSGVLLLDLQKLRSSNFLKDIQKYTLEYKEHLLFYEQSVINIYFHFNPERMYPIPCVWNYRTDLCQPSFTCNETQKQGIRFLHGSRSVFRKPTPFQAVFNAFRDEPLHRFSFKFLRYRIQFGLSRLSQKECGSRPEYYTYQLQRHTEPAVPLLEFLVRSAQH